MHDDEFGSFSPVSVSLRLLTRRPLLLLKGLKFLNGCIFLVEQGYIIGMDNYHLRAGSWNCNFNVVSQFYHARLRYIDHSFQTFMHFTGSENTPVLADQTPD
jgi:hypothetical protein